MKKCDLIIKNANIVTINKNDDVLYNKNLIIDQKKIIAIVDSTDNSYVSDLVHDIDGKLLMPGFINAHTHIPMSYFKGLADDLPLNIWLEKYIWPNEAKYLSEDFVYDASIHGIAELIRNGVTCFNDMYFFPLKTAEAADRMGVKAFIADVALDFPMGSFHNPENNYEFLDSYLNSFKNNDLIDFTIGPHSIYTCSTETLLKGKSKAEKYNKIFHTHLSETEFEINSCLEKHKKRPVEYLADLGLLNNKTIFAHGVWFNENEIDLLKQFDVSVALNTESNLKLASGFAPLKLYMDKGINLCFGTDGVASNNNLSIFDEMSITGKIHKALNNDPTFLKAHELLKMATINSAKALNIDHLTGSIETGKFADFIILDTNKVEATPYYDPYSLIVYSLGNGSVCDVFVNGNMIMKNRGLLNIDEQTIIDKANYYKNILRG
jgi:5-methylthioadenosine/S-adenosylhomocysteine deaminase